LHGNSASTVIIDLAGAVYMSIMMQACKASKRETREKSTIGFGVIVLVYLIVTIKVKVTRLYAVVADVVVVAVAGGRKKLAGKSSSVDAQELHL